MKNIRLLLLLSFNINYFQIANSPVIAVLYNNRNQNIDNIISKIKKEFNKQGYENITIFELNENYSNSFSSLCEFFFVCDEINEEESVFLYNLYFNENIINKLFFVYSSDDKFLLLEKIKKIEISFAVNEKNIYSAFQYIQNLNNENIVLKNGIKLLTQSLRNADVHQQLLRKDAENIIEWHKEEIAKIKKWYHQQYEILPLWYKKFGHILKKLLLKKT